MTSLIVIIYVQQSVAQMTQAERKIMGSMQRRIGPNKVGYQGLQQPFADGIKQIFKETVQPQESSNWIYIQAPFFTYWLAQLNWLIIPFDYGIAITEMIGGGILIILAISEQGIYGVIYSGWASNSKYSFIGGQRSAAQMISYSVSLSIIILTTIFLLGTVDLFTIILGQNIISQIFPQLPMAILFMISAIAETNRSPFDLPEAESELVSGFMTEYSGITFTFFFLGEYTNILTICTLFGILFLGSSFSLPLIFFILWIRACQARLRFDQLMALGWYHILPISICYIIFLPCLLFVFDLA